jgi:ABC-type transport system involved in multi-copper enzyme maturation permease subunit
MNKVLALSSVVVKELYRRKDFYVLFVLTALITLVMGSGMFVKDPKIVRYLKEICLLLIWVSALVIAIGTTARQLPAERENRTIFPLLAKPVSRGQVIMGKFAGCWFACGIGLVVFYIFFAIISGSREGNWPMLQYLQAFWLQWVMLGVVIALVLLGSVVFTAPSSNATICFIIVVGILLLGGHLNAVAVRQSEPWSSVTYTFYYLIPHLEWYDIRDLVIYNQNLVGWVNCLLATLYAAVYITFLLVATWIVFRRKHLST